MDIITKEDLEALLDGPGGWCVSLYMPTERAGDGVLQNPIRFKDMLGQVEERLSEAGVRESEARRLLQPARALVEDNVFWQSQGDGLALFLGEGFSEYYRLPYDFEPLVVVAEDFHIKPLLPIISGDGRFYVLALSQDEVELLQGTKQTVSEIRMETLPDSLTHVLRWDDPERRFQMHSATVTPGGERVQPSVREGHGRPAIFHGQGIASEDDPKDKIKRFFQRLDEGLEEVIQGWTAPVVLAGVDYLLPIYREANSYLNLVDEEIEGSPKVMSDEELHDAAWERVEPLFREKREEWKALYRQLDGQGDERASADVEEVVRAARFERVAALFVPVGVQRWGSFDAESGDVEVHEEQKPGDRDLFDLAAVYTLLNDGDVYAVEPEDVPGDGVIAAVFRY